LPPNGFAPIHRALWLNRTHPVCVCRLQRAFAGKEARKVVKDALHNDKNGTAWTRALKMFVDT